MIRSAVLLGIESVAVTITARKSAGPLQIVGLPEVAAREARVRVKSSLAQFGVEHEGVTVEIVPAVTSGQAASLDLAIALAAARWKLEAIEEVACTVVVGSLDLSGQVQPVRGILAHARSVGRMIVPRKNAEAASRCPLVFSCSTLGEALEGQCAREPSRRLVESDAVSEISELPSAAARRALEISAAGQHPLLIVGPPGCGKTMAARRLPGILPRLSGQELLDVATIYGAAGLGSSGDVLRPFRAPHHTVSEIGLVGGGGEPRPGEVTLAHHGVLFLDELPEYRRAVLSGLQRVLRERQVVVTQRDVRVVMPADPLLLVGAANGCGCGYLGSEARRCACTAERLASWRKRAAEYEAMFAMRVTLVEGGGSKGNESSAVVRARVIKARKRLASGEAPPLGAAAQRMLDEVFADKIKSVASVARTIAVLDEAREIEPEHMAEAIALRVGE
jgi:magnesium chelatase family protein